MKLTINNECGELELNSNTPTWAKDSKTTIFFEATPDYILEAVQMFNDEKIKGASSAAVE